MPEMLASERPTLNVVTLRIFAPLLVVTGILGFVLPASMAVMSGAIPYNLFHIFFGALGGVCLLDGDRRARLFNLGFGIVDLYQAVASAAQLFPAAHFEYTTADDVLHVVVGLALVAIGLYAPRRPAAA